MITGVAGHMGRAHRGTLHLPYLAVSDILLDILRLILIYGIFQMRIQSNQIRHTSGMVAMPMSEQNVRDPDPETRARRLDQFCPSSLSATCVNHDLVNTSADKEDIGALERELCNHQPGFAHIELDRHTLPGFWPRTRSTHGVICSTSGNGGSFDV